MKNPLLKNPDAFKPTMVASDNNDHAICQTSSNDWNPHLALSIKTMKRS